MCFDPDARPPIPPIAGGATEARDRVLTSADGTRIYVGAQYGGGIVVIDPETQSVLQVIPTPAGVRPLRPLGYLAAAAAPVMAYALIGTHLLAPAAALFLALGWVLAVMAHAVVRRAPADGPLAAVAITLFAPLYAGGLLSFLIGLRHGGGHDRPSATALVFLPLIVVWTCDSLAMAGGAVLGGPKFAPAISPRKTWSGTITGSVAATVVAPAYGALVLAPAGIALPPLRLALLGLVLSVLGQVGDLAESLLKREAGVKDSGGMFPGHGGVLDRLDSLYWALPTAVAFLTLWGAL